ncbi:TPA: hypothetical protein SI878_004417 [Salmonella enterica]|nr:hypothetical protein [Salmonella enterica]
MQLPTNLAEWRKEFPHGLSFAAVCAAYEAGLMNEQRYLFIYGQYIKATRYADGNRNHEAANRFRYKWEPPIYRKARVTKPPVYDFKLNIFSLINHALASRLKNRVNAKRF